MAARSPDAAASCAFLRKKPGTFSRPVNFVPSMRATERLRANRRPMENAVGRKQQNFDSVSRILRRSMRVVNRRRYSRAPKEFLLRYPLNSRAHNRYAHIGPSLPGNEYDIFISLEARAPSSAVERVHGIDE